MHQVHGGSRVERRLLSAAVLVTACLAALTACGTDDDTSSGSSGTGAGGSGGTGSGGFSSPTPISTPTPISPTSSPSSGGAVLGARVRCPNPSFGDDEPIPTTLVGVLQACRSVDGQILLKNDSALQLRVAPASTTLLTTPVQASEEFTDTLNAELAAAGSGVGAVLVPPGGYVVAYPITGAPVSVQVGVSLPDATQAYAASVIGRYIESKLATRPQRLATSVAGCAEDAGELWSSTRQSGQVDLDQLLAETALGPVLSCRKLMSEVSELAGDEAPTTESALTREFKALPKDLGATVWDDLLRYVRNLVTLAR